MRYRISWLCGLTVLVVTSVCVAADHASAFLKWSALPDLPDALGVAGPVVGVHNDALIVGGGANFPVEQSEDLWEVDKAWHDDVWVLIRDGQTGYRWLDGFHLPSPVAYAACVTTPYGVACLGGADGTRVVTDAYLVRWDPEKQTLKTRALPDLPAPNAFGAATLIGNTIYLAGGQSGLELKTAAKCFWRLDLTQGSSSFEELAWETLPAWPGPSRALNLTIAQHNGFDDCVYVISGRRQKEGTDGIAGFEFLRDVYEFNPKHYSGAEKTGADATGRADSQTTGPWRRRSDVPVCVMAGTGAAIGQSHVFVLSGADGSLMAKADALKDRHPGFPKRAWAYHTITDRWIDAGSTPSNQVTTPATRWGGLTIVASGEVRPRVRTRKIWAITPVAKSHSFGTVNSVVLVIYLLGMVAVGAYFARRNRDTNDFFRGGQRVVWWAAGCSIFATMLSSITYMAIPAKAFAQDLVYLVGNMMILAVAPIAVYIALPFFRRIDATSAYEYLEKRFSRSVRCFASASFTLYHLFRMGIVMSLAALALATVTPLTASQSVLIMGLLSVAYCTLGGVEAVIWTDTIQTVVLLGGALICVFLMIAGTDGGVVPLFQSAAAEGKLSLANFHWDATSASLALWVVVIGAIGQNISSYTADQAVVQRYMTTPDRCRAANAIWTAAVLAIPATWLFFLLGTGLWAFYRSNPDRLDPTFMTDQIFPLFIVHEVPVGLAGLIVAGIFAAAQSTISTSMNSTATTVVTDFMRPWSLVATERGYLNWARVLTFLFGAAGTALALLFVDPMIRSLFDQFIKIIGLFMGVLGGLFALGILTRRANATGALVGALAGVAMILIVQQFTGINGYLYAAIGILSCCFAGYVVSLLTGPSRRDLTGLTLHTPSTGTERNATVHGMR